MVGRVIAPAWSAPPARAIPQLRRKLAAWLNEYGPAFYENMILAGRQAQRPAGPARESARALAAAERHRVVAGELFWVSAEMGELARHAGGQLTRRELYRHDLPSACGLMVFAEPLASYVNSEGRTVEIVAASWGPWSGPDRVWEPGGGTWITFLSHPAPFLPANASIDDPRSRDLARELAPMMPDNECGWPFGPLAEDQEFPEDSTARWAQSLCAAWLLMRQPLVTVTRQRHGKPRRTSRGERLGSEVRLVHVCPRTGSTRATTGDQERAGHDHQWWVRGHWRRYHCGPGGQRVERRYITAHLAGPDDKPVRGVERVRVWDR